MKNQQASAHVKALSLTDMSSAFVLLGLGLSLAVLVFLIELIYKRIKDNYFTVQGVPTTVIRHPIVQTNKTDTNNKPPNPALQAPKTAAQSIHPGPPAGVQNTEKPPKTNPVSAPIAVQTVQPAAGTKKVPQTRPLTARKTVKFLQRPATVVDKTSPLPAVLDGKAPIIPTPPVVVATASADKKKEKQQLITKPTIAPPPPAALPGTVNEY